MHRLEARRITWFDVLSRRFNAIRNGVLSQEREQLVAAMDRAVLVARVRWLILLLMCVYSVYAGSIYFFSRYGFFLSDSQFVFLFGSALAVVSYNFVYRYYYERIAGLRFVDHLPIILDLLFVTVLIHFSGGAVSWFWPVYLIVIIEAAYLLEQRKDVLLLGLLGVALYGALLATEYASVIAYVAMPFVDAELHHDVLYLILIWSWVTLLIMTVSIIGFFLMSVIRREANLARESEERLFNFLDSASDLIHSNTPDGRFLYANNSWLQTMGYSHEELANLSLFDIMHADSRQHCREEFKRAMEGEKSSPLEALYLSRHGRAITVEGNISCSSKDTEPVAIWGICHDVTERKLAQEQLHRQAHYDNLTGLPNRLLFMDRLQQAGALAHRSNLRMAVLFFDLDRFKIINDTLGHTIGDRVLVAVARRLKVCMREIDTVARIGGDEFAMTLVNLNEAEDAETVARKILKKLAQPYTIDIHELFITASIGISIYPDNGTNPDNLLKNADIAMYHAKGQGKNNYQFYTSEMDKDADRKLGLENSLRRSVEREELIIYYQPKVDIRSGTIIAMEALIRWEHPEFGLLSPAEFIPLAEETGMIIPIGEWVLLKACQQNKAWQDYGLPPMRVAVNLSAYQLQHKTLIDSVKNALESSGMEASYLELEVTETVIMQNPDFAVSILSELREIGVHISIDDFGTGYSSLAHLKRFSVNTLKIDKAFVRDVEIDTTDAAIAIAIIAMGNSLNLKVIAEGVETVGQLAFLKDNQCDEMQGYLFSRPMPAEDVVGFMRDSGRKLPLLTETGVSSD
jgi:diguanylate cyclase (GGDEF)-like protein/PAS domain S-box-containing protein